MAFIYADGTPVENFDQFRPPEPPSTQDIIERDEPDFMQLLGAAARQENTVVSTFSSKTFGLNRYDYEEGYNFWEDIKGTEYEDYADEFATVFNKRYADALKAQIQQEKKDRRDMQASSGLGLVAGIGTGIVDLPSLIPGFGLIRGIRGGYAVGKSALALGAAGALDASVSEAALQRAQAARPIEESALAIGFSTIISGALGATVAKVVGAAENKRLSKLLSEEAEIIPQEPNVDDFAGAYDNTIAGGSLSAGVPDKDSFIDPKQYDYANRAQKVLAKAAVLNPMLALLASASDTARKVVANLPEMSFAMKMTSDGTSQPQAAETLVKEWTQGRVGLGIRTLREEHKAMNKAGEAITYKEFSHRVARALRRNDTDEQGSDYVSRAAQSWRKNLIAPLRKEAIDAKLLPEDVQVTTADSYFTRMYRRNEIIKREWEFKKIVRNWAQRSIRDIDTRAGKVSFENEQDRKDYIENIVNDIYGKVTGRANPGGTAFIKAPKERGPLKERTFNIPDKEIEDFLENDVEIVMRRYARVMGADVELAKKFGRADMTDQIDEVHKDYDKLRAEIAADEKLAETKKGKRLDALRKAELKDIRNIEGLRDRLRGTHMLDNNMSDFGRAVQVVNTLNYVRLLGGVVPSSMSDVARHIMVHGLGRFMIDGIGPMIVNMRGFKVSAAEAKVAGSAAEVLNNTRMATWAELADPYGFDHPAMRFVSHMGQGFSKINGMVYWNDFQKSFASVMTQNRLLKNAEKAYRQGFDKLSRKEKQYMGLLGVGRGDAERIGKLYARHGDAERGVRIANTEKWGADTDEEAYDLVRKYRAAVNKEVDTTIVTKGIGDTPLFADSNLGRIVLQFKSFMLASNQRIMMRATSDEMAGVISGLATSVAIGMMVYAFKQWEKGEELTDNPGKWLAEGIDLSGITGPLMGANNMAEKLGIPGIYAGAQSLFPTKDQSAPASRYAQRSIVGSSLGPSFGLAKDITTSFGAVMRNIRHGEEITEGEKRNMRGLLPGSTLPLIKSYMYAQ